MNKLFKNFYMAVVIICLGFFIFNNKEALITRVCEITGIETATKVSYSVDPSYLDLVLPIGLIGAIGYSLVCYSKEERE